MGKKAGVLLALLLSAIIPAKMVLAAETVLLDATASTEGWMIFNDAKATGSLKVTGGPNSTWKALEMSYDLTGGNWVAFIKKLPAGMEKMKALIFYYRGDGKYNLEVKVQDADGAVFGIKIPGGAEVAKWMKIVIPIEDLEYLWGGTKRVLEPKNIRQIEISVSTDGKGGPGKMMVSNIRYSMEAMQASLPKGTAPVKITAEGAPAQGFQRGGNIDIGELNSWSKYAEKGADITLSLTEGPSRGEKALDVKYTWGQRAIPGVQEETGVWVAVVKQINMDLSEMRSLTFTYKGSGAAANLEVKVVDPSGTRYGRVFPSGSLSANWKTITIPRSDFKYMWGGDGSGKFTWTQVKTLEISLSRTVDPRDHGDFQLSNIKFESAVLTQPLGVGGAKAAPTTGQVQAVIDDFSNLNLNNRYFTVVGDDSTLTLDSSRITFQSDYSMRMRYQLQSNRPNGSWVEAQRRFAPALDWTNVTSVKVWVKGDASRNIFRFTITDGEGRKWVNDNTEVLASTDWYLLDMPIDSFVLYGNLNSKKKEPADDLKRQLSTIRQIGMAIISQPGVNSRSSGEVFVEKLYVVGAKLNMSAAVPGTERPPVGIAVPLKNWNLGGTSESLVNQMETTGTTFTQNLTFRLIGNYDLFSVWGEMALDSTFGNEDDGIRSKSATVSAPNVNVTLINPINGINNIIIGNLWFDESPDLFANNNQFGGWGFKGIQTEGWVDRFHHRLYFLQHDPDSYTFAGSGALTYAGFNMHIIGTYFNQAPFIVSATKLEKDDKAIFLDLNQDVVIPQAVKATLSASLGYNWYGTYWDVTTQEALQEREDGAFVQAGIDFSDLSNIFWQGLSFSGKYRRVSPYFKPIFREDPYTYDGETGDTDGYAARVYQSFGGAYISCDYSKYARISDDKGRLEDTIVSLGYNDWKSMDLALTQEFKQYRYYYIDNRFEREGEPTIYNENDQRLISRLSIAYHFSGTFIIQEALEYQTIKPYTDEENYSQMVSTIKVSYTPAPNLTLSFENRFTRYGRTQDQPVIDVSAPSSVINYIYDYTKMKLDLNF